MLELMLQLELIRESLRKKMLPTANANDYHFVGTILALIFASGAVASAGTLAWPALTQGGPATVVVLVAGVLFVLTIVLLPLGLLLL